MSSDCYSRRSWCVRACTFLLWVLSPILAAAQTPSPWNGAIGRELFSHPVAGEHSMSADGRYQVFETDAPLVADDTNGTVDVYVRDNESGFVLRASVGTGPIAGPGAPQGDQPSGSGAVSGDGRHILFRTRNSFDPTDTNGVSDLYVRDLGSGITSLVTFGSADERLHCDCAPLPEGRFSGDGRFIVFSADFGSAGGSLLWIRDRDTDGIASFDYPPTVTTTAIDVRSVGSDVLFTIDNVAISRDGRYVAFVAGAVDESNLFLGTRLYLHDRQLGTTIRVDRPLASSGDVAAQAFSPDLSDNGLLVYTSTAPNLVPGDTDASPDVFVYDIAAGSQERVSLTHGSFNLLEAYGTVISSDGRYVAFTGLEAGSDGNARWSVFAFDRAEHTSHDVSLLLDGTRDPEALAVGMSADGLQIAYWSGSSDVVYDGPQGWGLYVATTVALSPPEIRARTDGDLVPIEVAVPDGVSWTARLVSGESRYDYTEYSTYTGIGPATIEVLIPYNQTGIPATYQVWLGSKTVTIRQPITPVIMWIDHDFAPASGGEPFQIYGFNFQPGATVTFGDVPATGVTVDVGEFDATISGIIPPHQPGLYRVVVHSPDGEVSPDEIYLYYYDDTPPLITANVNGTLGANGWYTSNVTIDWTVEDPDSGITYNTCVPVTQTTDVALRSINCVAGNGEGLATDSFVEIKRDATPPVIAIVQPQSQAYRQGQNAPIQFSCGDTMSGVASCTGNQSGTLDTTALGSFSFVVTAVDLAGNTATTTVAYTVVPKPTLRVIAINATKVFGETLPSFSVMFEGFVSGDTAASLGGSLSFSTAATATSAPGSYSVTPGGYTSANYSIDFVAGTLTVTKAATTLALSSTPDPSHPNQTVPLSAAVSAAAPGAGLPTGWVLFSDDDTVIGWAPLVNGVATISRKFKMGTHALTAIYFGDSNFVSSSGSAQHQTN